MLQAGERASELVGACVGGGEIQNTSVIRREKFEWMDGKSGMGWLV